MHWPCWWICLQYLNLYISFLFLATMNAVPCSIISQCSNCNDGPVCTVCVAGYVLDTRTGNFLSLTQPIHYVFHAVPFRTAKPAPVVLTAPRVLLARLSTLSSVIYASFSASFMNKCFSCSTVPNCDTCSSDSVIGPFCSACLTGFVRDLSLRTFSSNSQLFTNASAALCRVAKLVQTDQFAPHALLASVSTQTSVLCFSFSAPPQCVSATIFPNCIECINGPECSICQPNFYLDFGTRNLCVIQSTNHASRALSYPTACLAKMAQSVFHVPLVTPLTP
jgi:hypothetical protein